MRFIFSNLLALTIVLGCSSTDKAKTPLPTAIFPPDLFVSFNKNDPESLKKLDELISTHIQYDGLQHGRQFDLIDPYRQKTVCEPWCKVKGFCPRFGEVMKFE